MPDTMTAPAASDSASSSSSTQSSSGTEQTFDHSLGESSQSNASNGANSQDPNVSTLSAGTKPEHKRESHYQRVKRQKAALREREAQLAQREAQIAQNANRVAQAEQAARKPKRDYTLADLKKVRPVWAQEAEWDPAKAELVKQADAEIKVMEAEEQQAHGQEAHAREWHQAEAELAQADKEFMRQGTRLDTKLREILGGPDGQAYRGHPRGIVAAYHRAKMEILEGDHKTALGKIQQLEAELKRLTGLTSISGGAPGRVGSGNQVETLNDFARLSSADMLKHLKSKRSGSMPWL